MVEFVDVPCPCSTWVTWVVSWGQLSCQAYEATKVRVTAKTGSVCLPLCVLYRFQVVLSYLD